MGRKFGENDHFQAITQEIGKSNPTLCISMIHFAAFGTSDHFRRKKADVPRHRRFHSSHFRRFPKKCFAGCLFIIGLLSAVSFAPQSINATELDFLQTPCAPALASPFTSSPKKNASLWFTGGHIESGLFANAYGRDNRYENGTFDPESGNTALLQNVRQSDFQLNQLYLNFGKKLNSHCSFDIGGRVDVMYGTDAIFLQSYGLEKDESDQGWHGGDYYTALPQLYVEAGMANFNVKMGKFLSPMGAESILSPDRFFYSLADSYEQLPDTMTGVLGQWDVNNKLSLFGGWVNGENRSFDNEKDSAILGDISYQWNKRFRFGYSALARLDTRTRTSDDMFRFIQSFIVGYKHKRIDYTFEWTLRNQKTGSGGRLEYGINQELIYRLNTRWSVGTRFGWLHRYTKSGVPHDRYNLSIGARWQPNKWLTIRPEIRYDLSDGTTPFAKPKDGSPGGRKDQFSGGVSTIIKF